MANFFPNYNQLYPENMPRAEIQFYEACQNLPKSFSIFHSVAWISNSNGRSYDGEADFLVCNPDRGILVIEVKGGKKITADYTTAKWTSTDHNGNTHPIKDPVAQALKSKYNILSKIKEHPNWHKLGVKQISIGHAVFFPGIDSYKSLKGPSTPLELIGGRPDLRILQQWIINAFEYWSLENKNDPLGSRGMQLVKEVFARTIETKSLIYAEMEEEEKHRIILTSNQLRTLDFICRQRRVAVSGGAGTGKTVLALEKAQRLASEGFKTLLTCYNVPLADHLKTLSSDCQNLEVMNFHKLCKNFIDKAEKLSGRDLIQESKSSNPGLELWDHYFPNALAYSLDIVDTRYDAIVIDEGQDFGEEFWFPIEMLLTHNSMSPLYIFHDENQNIYSRVSSFPTEVSPIVLSDNCRNTKQIHDVAYRFYKGMEVSAPNLVGHDIVKLMSETIKDQANQICSYVSQLIIQEKVPASAITVLICNSAKKVEHTKILKTCTSAKKLTWKNLNTLHLHGVLIETVARFKGLESEIIVLWGIEDLSEEITTETLYVGASRAKSILVVSGTKEALGKIL